MVPACHSYNISHQNDQNGLSLHLEKNQKKFPHLPLATFCAKIPGVMKLLGSMAPFLFNITRRGKEFSHALFIAEDLQQTLRPSSHNILMPLNHGLTGPYLVDIFCSATSQQLSRPCPKPNGNPGLFACERQRIHIHIYIYLHIYI